MLIYIQEVIWIEDQGEGTPLRCTLYFSYFRTSFSFSLWLGEWDHFTRRTETFQKISNMYGYFLYILHCMDFSVNFRWWGEGGEWWLHQVHRAGRQHGVWTPQCAASWMLLLYARDSSRWLLTPGPQFLSRGGAQTFWHRAYTVMQSWLQHHYSSLQCHMILLIRRFADQETFIFIINVENSCAA